MDKITPEAYKKLKEAELEGRARRDYTIRLMREGDPDYWTTERLATHWGVSKQTVSYICNREEK